MASGGGSSTRRTVGAASTTAASASDLGLECGGEAVGSYAHWRRVSVERRAGSGGRSLSMASRRTPPWLSRTIFYAIAGSSPRPALAHSMGQSLDERVERFLDRRGCMPAPFSIATQSSRRCLVPGTWSSLWSARYHLRRVRGADFPPGAGARWVLEVSAVFAMRSASPPPPAPVWRSFPDSAP